jgi:NAD(P)H dehydrogenase (quinone)
MPHLGRRRKLEDPQKGVDMKSLAFVLLALAGEPTGAQEAKSIRILIAFHSESGNTETLARAVQEGAQRVAGVEISLRKVGEVGAQEILTADGILVGTPVHWAGLSAESKRFLDRVGQVLMEAKALEREGRTAGAFVTGDAVASGKELARVAIVSAFLNLRFLVLGGIAADGFGTLGPQATTGPEDPGLSEVELEEARRSGERFARLTREIRGAISESR